MTDSAGIALNESTEERRYYSLNNRVYAVFAYVYDAVTFPLRNLRSEVASAVDVPPGSRVLDVATGTGEQAFVFAGRAAEVIGIDISPAMLRVARRKSRFVNVRFEEADAARLPFGDATFDASCVSFALHEMPGSIRGRVVREMARVTKPGGSVTVVDYGLPERPLARWLVYHLVKVYESEHYPDFVKSDVGELLRREGVEPEQERLSGWGVTRIIRGRKLGSRRAAPQP